MNRLESRETAALGRRFLLAAAIFAGAAVAGLPSMAHAAMVADPGCAAKVLPRNDDGWTSTSLGFGINFGGAFHTQLYVANNGYVTFGSAPPGSFGLAGGVLALDIATTWRTVIAPFVGDVDTRPLASDVVTYGPITFAGRPAFCVNWGGNNGVGFYDMKADLRNKFQLILASRPDSGVGDFDIIMNYDQIQWDLEVGKIVNNFPLPARPTGVGYNPGNRFAVPGAGVLPSGMLDGQSNALISGSSGSAVLGRYVFPVRNGLPPDMAVIAGTLYKPSGSRLAGAAVQLCRTDDQCSSP